jgi:hypothetical protein
MRAVVYRGPYRIRIEDKPVLAIEELRATIPGWGVDIEARERRAVPKEKVDLQAAPQRLEARLRGPAAVRREGGAADRGLALAAAAGLETAANGASLARRGRTDGACRCFADLGCARFGPT